MQSTRRADAGSTNVELHLYIQHRRTPCTNGQSPRAPIRHPSRVSPPGPDTSLLCTTSSPSLVPRPRSRLRRLHQVTPAPCKIAASRHVLPAGWVLGVRVPVLGGLLAPRGDGQGTYLLLLTPPRVPAWRCRQDTTPVSPQSVRLPESCRLSYAQLASATLVRVLESCVHGPPVRPSSAGTQSPASRRSSPASARALQVFNAGLSWCDLLGPACVSLDGPGECSCAFQASPPPAKYSGPLLDCCKFLQLVSRSVLGVDAAYLCKHSAGVFV